MRELVFRGYGLLERDLEINFQQRPNPNLVTQILHCCAADKLQVRSGDFWEMTVGQRLVCSLSVVAATGIRSIEVILNCSKPGCNQRLTVELSIEELINLGKSTLNTTEFQVDVDGRSFKFRKPTGNDQREWLQHPHSDKDTLMNSIFGTLLVEPQESVELGQVLKENLDWIDSEFNQRDPLVGFSMTVLCPYCEGEISCDVELQEVLIKELRKVQIGLLSDIHRLAAHYHWNEEQILSLPTWRRDQYLAFIEQEGSK